MPQFHSMRSSGSNAGELSKKKKHSSGGLLSSYNRGELPEEHHSGGLLSKYNSGGLPGRYNSGGLLSKYNSGGLPGKYSGRMLPGKYSSGGLAGQPVIDSQIVVSTVEGTRGGYRQNNAIIEPETEPRQVVAPANPNRSLQVQAHNQYDMSLAVSPQHRYVRTIQLHHIVSSSAMERLPVVIPGSKVRLRETEELPRQRPLHPVMRHGILSVAILGMFLFCMVTLTPLGGTHTNALLQLVTVSTNSGLSMSGNGTSTGSSSSNGSAEGTWTDASPGSTDYYIALARADAVKWGISPDYYQRQIQQESHFDPYAQSGVGAIGIAQFMPTTAAEYGVNPYDPVQSLDGGAHMMSDLNNEFYGDYAKALAAYNAGAGAVDDAVAACGTAWLSCMDGQPQAYVEIIMYGASE